MGHRQTWAALALTVAVLAAFGTSAAHAVTFEQAALAAGYTYASTDISVRSKGIDSLAGVNLFTAANSISAPSNHISNIDSDQFSGMSSLTELDLFLNQITSIEAGRFLWAQQSAGSVAGP